MAGRDGCGDHCVDAQPNPNPIVGWATHFGGTSTDWAFATRSDSQGRLVMVGKYGDSLAVGGYGTQTSAGDSDVLAMGLDDKGRPRWVQSFGGSGADVPWDLAMTADGKAIVAGVFSGEATFGARTLTSKGLTDAFVAQLDTLGNVEWITSFGGTGRDEARAVAVHADGSITVCGSFETTISFGSTIYTSAGGLDSFVAHLDARGNVIGSNSLSGIDDQILAGVATAGDKSVVVGFFQGSASFSGGQPISSSGSYDIVVAALDSGVQPSWAHAHGGGGDDRSTTVATNPSGAIFVGGHFSDAFDPGGGTLTSAGNWDALLMRLTTSGNVVWATSFGGSGSDRVLSIALGANGQLGLTGSFQQSLSLAGSTLTPAGERDIVVASFDQDGKPIRAASFGGSGYDRGIDIGASKNGFVVSGHFADTIRLGDNTFTAAGGEDLYLFELLF